MYNVPWRLQIPIHLRREMVTLAMLTGLAIVLLVGVTALSELYHAQQDSLADRWSGRGANDLAAGHYKAAEQDYRTALRYARDGYSQQLGLAQSLIGLGRMGEASVYLENLWVLQPEDGIANRELARIAAGKGDTRNALRYYHNAIYATWPEDPSKERENTRWELIKYLLSIHGVAQAQSQLILLGAEVGDNPIDQLNLGQYFLKVQDGQHALAAFRVVLRADPHSARALAGAGEAAFDLGNYTLAQHYLSAVVARDPADRDSASLLEVTTEVTRLDPFRRQISDAERNQAVEAAFAAVGDRLKTCATIAGEPVTAPDQPVASQPAASQAATKQPAAIQRLAAAISRVTGRNTKTAAALSPAPGTGIAKPPVAGQATAAPQASEQTFAEAWAQLSPKVNDSGIRRNPDIVNEVMNLSFAIERQAGSKCGSGTPSDAALLLISKLHEGS